MPEQQINLTKWQDYRGKQEGTLFYLKTASYSILPIDDVLSYKKETKKSEPDYETNTFGLSHCIHQKLRANFIKLRKSYVFFTSVYGGQEQEYKKKHLIHGYMLVSNILNVQPQHRRKWVTTTSDENIPDCFNKEDCFAFYGKKTHYYSLKDSLELTSDLLQEWGYKSRLSRNMKINLEGDSLQFILKHFNNKTSINSTYQQELQDILSRKEEFIQSTEEEDEW